MQLAGNYPRNSFNPLSNWQNFYCVKICLEKYSLISYSNTNLLSIQNKYKKLLSKEILRVIICLNLYWHTYNSNQNNCQHICMYLSVSKKLVSLLLSSLMYKVAQSFASFLSEAKMSLKNIQCAICMHIKNLIYLPGLEYIIEKNNVNTPRLDDQLLKSIIYSIRQQLYHKNKKGYWRANRYIKTSEAILRARKVLLEWCSKSPIILSKLDALKVNRVIDYTLYRWCKK